MPDLHMPPIFSTSHATVFRTRSYTTKLIIAAMRSTVIPGVFLLRALAHGDITVPPPSSVDHLKENSDKFMLNPTIKQFVVTNFVHPSHT
ncbi:hypothetical protein BGY98DRAFT_1104293 [Russula aff. rugulosa BPL654]|nr:hypothetical protein BGY98DRAFT_1104293 [Russula aff. rugulosa BPL654]